MRSAAPARDDHGTLKSRLLFRADRKPLLPAGGRAIGRFWSRSWFWLSGARLCAVRGAGLFRVGAIWTGIAEPGSNDRSCHSAAVVNGFEGGAAKDRFCWYRGVVRRLSAAERVENPRLCLAVPVEKPVGRLWLKLLIIRFWWPGGRLNRLISQGLSPVRKNQNFVTKSWIYSGLGSLYDGLIGPGPERFEGGFRFSAASAPSPPKPAV